MSVLEGGTQSIQYIRFLHRHALYTVHSVLQDIFYNYFAYVGAGHRVQVAHDLQADDEKVQKKVAKKLARQQVRTKKCYLMFSNLMMMMYIHV